MPIKSICFINSSRFWGGEEKWHFDNACYLSQKGYQVTVITNVKSKLYEKLITQKDVNLKQINISNLSFLNPFCIIKLIRLLKKTNTAKIIINLPSDLKIIGVASLFTKINTIIYRRGSAIPIKNSFTNKLLFSKVVTHLIVNSLATKKTVLQNNKNLFPEGKIKLIYNGIDINAYTQQEITIDKKDNKEIILGHLGRFSAEKNQSFLIHVASELRKNNIPFRMILGGNGPTFDEISRIIEDEKLNEHIQLIGFVENIPQFMQSIDVFLLPSLWEGFGYVSIEAMICEKPVIAFNVASNPEIIVNNKTGYLTKINDVQVFTEKIHFFYHHPEKIKEMGHEGRSRVLQYFNIVNSFTQLENYLNQL